MNSTTQNLDIDNLSYEQIAEVISENIENEKKIFNKKLLELLKNTKYKKTEEWIYKNIEDKWCQNYCVDNDKERICWQEKCRNYVNIIVKGFEKTKKDNRDNSSRSNINWM